MKTEKYRRILPDIARFFDLGRIIEVEKAGGDANANFFVKTEKGDFIVKIILEPHTKDNKLREVEYVRHLAKYGIPVAPYLASPDGSVIFRNDHDMAMVQNLVLGYNPDITIDSVSQIGKSLGKLSRVPTTQLSYRYGWLSPEYIKDNLAKINRNFPNNSNAHKILSVFASCNKFIENVLSRLPKSIIHGDMHSYNVIFRDKRLVAFVDWEDSMIAPALFDFVSSAAYWCFEDGIMRPRLYRTFYQSYTQERPLSNLETEYLEDCMRYIGVVQTMWRFLNCRYGNKYHALWGLKLADWKAPKM